jgi:hypothetical protein
MASQSTVDGNCGPQIPNWLLDPPAASVLREAMALLYIVGSIIILRALIGWEVRVSKSRVLPKHRARYLALALLPMFALADEKGLLGVCFVLYLLAFAILGCLFSVARASE